MALHRQGSANIPREFVSDMNGDYRPAGSQRSASVFRHDSKIEHKNAAGSRLSRQGDLGYEGSRNLLRRDPVKVKRTVARTAKTKQCSMGVFALLLLLLVARAQLKTFPGLHGKDPIKQDELRELQRTRKDLQDEKQRWSASENVVHGPNKTLEDASLSEDDEYDDDGGETGTIRRASDFAANDEQEDENGEAEEEKGDGDAVAGNIQRADGTAAVLPAGMEEQPDLGKSSYDTRLKVKKRRSVPCEIAFANSTTGVNEPEDVSKFAHFSLQYVEREERPEGDPNWEPRFAGHQTMAEREETFYARSQTLHCGFVQGPKGSASTGFDVSDDDKDYLSSCRYAVASAIFNNSDHIRSPTMKKVSIFSKKNVCFVMFVDQTTLDVMEQENEGPNVKGRVGLWKVVLVQHMPSSDARRTGKVPKLLSHRLFPSARFSIWLDSKLRLQADPLLVFEYFLWRRGAEYAISNHYDRHDVGEEVLQNKKLNKFNHTIIDQQFHFYQQDGLTKFNASDPNKLLPSYVPEGSFIVRAHTPMSNLFSCLWFNEVDRFTPRDQLSFAYTYMKLARMNTETSFGFHMFKDCERKALAKLFHHRNEDKAPRVVTTNRVHTTVSRRTVQ